MVEESNFIFSPISSSKNNRKSYNTSDMYYTILGEHDFIDINNHPRAEENNKNILAKVVYSETGLEKCYIKIGSHGKVYNPLGLYSEGKHSKFVSKTGKNEYNFKKVNRKIFDMYINFLSTKNLAWLNNAERELT